MKIPFLVGVVLFVLPFCAGADTMRPAVGKPLQEAEILIQRQDYHAALLKLDQASSVKNLTPYETVVIAQLRGTAAAGTGDYKQAASAYQAVLASGTQPAAMQMQLIQAIAGFYYQLQDYPHTITWVNRYDSVHGTDPRTRALLVQSYYQEGDYIQAEQAAWREAHAAQAAGQAVPEGALQLLASAAQKSGDQPGYAAALNSLLVAYPKPQYWNEAIGLVAAMPHFPDSLTFDVERLRFATGTLSSPADYEDYAERAILAGRPVEAKTVVDYAFTHGILTSQTDAGHAQRLKILATKDAAAPPPSGAGNDDLDRGIAYLEAGNSAAAITEFKKTVAGEGSSNTPEAALAQLWLIQADKTEK